MDVARALTNSSLRELRAWRCAITCCGTKALAEAIREHRTMKRLDLTGNEIMPDGTYEVLSAEVDHVVDITIAMMKVLKFIKRRQKGIVYFFYCMLYI